MKLTVYTTSWCRDCLTAKRFLAKHQIAFTEVNIDHVAGAAEELVRQVGKRAVPQFVLDDRWIQPYTPGKGFHFAEMSKLLGVPYP